MDMEIKSMFYYLDEDPIIEVFYELNESFCFFISYNNDFTY